MGDTIKDVKYISAPFPAAGRTTEFITPGGVVDCVRNGCGERGGRHFPAPGAGRGRGARGTGSTPAALLCLLPALSLLLTTALLPSAARADGSYPDIEVRVSKNPSPGEEFSVHFTLRSHQSANYTITVSPRPEFAFMDESNGSRTYEVPDGAAVDYVFPMKVSRSAAEGEYLFSYTVVREGATVKIDTFTVKVGSLPCTFGVILLPSLALLGALAGWCRAGARPLNAPSPPERGRGPVGGSGAVAPRESYAGKEIGGGPWSSGRS